MNLKLQLKKLPDGPGIYEFYGEEGRLLYVGKSVSIKKRVSSYFSSKDLGPKTNRLVSNIKKVEFIKVFSEFEALMLEAELIRKNQPFYNIEAKDDKSPIYIKVTKTEIPLVSTARRPQTGSGEFIKGPFQNAKVTRQILREIRKIFPYCHHSNPKKPCLYVHLGLCPYPYGGGKSKEKYQITVRKIKSLLNGKTATLEKSLISEMKKFASVQKYEEANQIKKQLQKLEDLKTSFHSPREFIEKPTLVDDLNNLRLKELKKVLGLKRIPKRIECYDISNISGKNATGSMVVFQGGKPEKSQYRRFKIKFGQKPNDYLMMSEVLKRRFKNNWPKPDLVVIDGGKGQLSTALKVKEDLKIDVTIVSLAKRIEEIFVPWQSDSIKLPKESPARQLVQAARDEAHRFAITYHRNLRNKQLTALK